MIKKSILIGIGILLLVGVVAYGWQHYSDLRERSKIRDEQEEIQAELEKADLEHIAEKDRLYRELADKRKMLAELERRYCDLETQIANISVPTNPNSLVDAYHRLGYRSAVIRSR